MAVQAPYLPPETDEALQRWLDVVVRMLEAGSSMADAAATARRVVDAMGLPTGRGGRTGRSGTFAKHGARDTIPVPSARRMASGSK